MFTNNSWKFTLYFSFVIRNKILPTLPIQCRYRAALQCNKPIVAHLMHRMVRVNKIVISTAGSDCEKYPSEMYKENRDTQSFISGPHGWSSFLSTTIPFSKLAAATSFPRVEWKAGGKKETERFENRRDTTHACTFYKFATSIVGGHDETASSGNALESLWFRKEFDARLREMPIEDTIVMLTITGNTGIAVGELGQSFHWQEDIYEFETMYYGFPYYNYYHLPVIFWPI